MFKGIGHMIWHYLVHMIGVYQCIPDMKSIILVEIILSNDFWYEGSDS